jgi:hypothetical protein
MHFVTHMLAKTIPLTPVQKERQMLQISCFYIVTTLSTDTTWELSDLPPVPIAFITPMV